MRNTIKAKHGYSVKYFERKNAIATHWTRFGKVYDGDELIMTAAVRSYEDYLDEKEQNECFVQYEVFTTEKGNQFIYWGDTEFGFDYITKVTKE